MKWASVKAEHVRQACDALLRSKAPVSKLGGLVVVYKDHQLPAKAVLRLAYRVANNIPSETKLKFSSGETSLQILRSLGFRAERLTATRTGNEQRT